MSSKASKAAYRRCPETCQKVRSEIADAIQDLLESEGIDLPTITISRLTDVAFDASLEHGTERVRAALIECEDELIEAREACDVAEDGLKDARSRVDELENEVTELENELDTARSLADDASRT